MGTINNLGFEQAAGTLGEPAAWRLAGSHENRLIRSEEFDNGAAWTLSNATIDPNADTVPASGPRSPGDQLHENTTNDFHLAGQAYTIANAPATTGTYTFSAYVKPLNRTWALIGYAGPSGQFALAWFNLATGAVGSTTTNVTAVSSDMVSDGEWTRCSITITGVPDGASTFFVASATANAVGQFAGVTSPAAIAINGAQLVRGTIPGEYQRTVGSAVVPAVEVAGFLGTENLLRFSETIDVQATDSYGFGWDTFGHDSFDPGAGSTPPSGPTSPATVLVEDAHNGQHLLGQGFSTHDWNRPRFFDIGSHTTDLVFTVYVKPRLRTWVDVAPRYSQDGVTDNGLDVSFHLVGDGAVGAHPAYGGATYRSAKIENIGNGWYRCTVVMGVATDLYSVGLYVIAETADNTNSFAGSNGSASLEVAGATCGRGTSPGRYLPTGASPADGRTGFETFEQAWANNTFAAFAWADVVTETARWGASLLSAEDFEKEWANSPYLRTTFDSTARDFHAFENWLLDSRNVGGAAWTPAGVTFGPGAGAASPVLPYPASDQIIEQTSGDNIHGFQQTAIASASGLRTASAIVKAGTRSWCALLLFDPLGTPVYQAAAWFNLGTGALGTAVSSGPGTAADGATTSAIQDLGGGWYRVSISAPVKRANYTCLGVLVATADVSFTYTATPGDVAMLFAGAQAEGGAPASSFIMTEGVGTSRPADAVTAEVFDRGWEDDDHYVTAFTGIGTDLIAASFDTGTPEAVEDFEEEWDSNEDNLSAFVGIGTDLTAALFAGQRALTKDDFENVLAPQRFGGGTAITVDTSADQFTYNSHPLAADYQLRFTIDEGLAGGTAGTLPGGISAAQYYYATTIATNTFKLHNRIGDTSVVDISTQPTGIVYLSAPGEFWTQLMATI